MDFKTGDMKEDKNLSIGNRKCVWKNGDCNESPLGSEIEAEISGLNYVNVFKGISKECVVYFWEGME